MTRYGRQMLVLAALLCAGCTDLGTTQDVNELQAQVARLEERVAQLEGVDVLLPEAAGFPELVEPGAVEAPASTAPGAARQVAQLTSQQIQQALKNAGFYQGRIDGKIGSMTREAIRAFQAMHDLTIDGIVGQKTWARLRVYAEAPEQEPGALERLQ